MEQQKFSARRRQVIVAGGIGAGALAAPVAMGAKREPVVRLAEGKMVVSGRILGADLQPLTGAQIEIWPADAQGTRAQARVVAVSDGDGRYFAAVPSQSADSTQRLHYRVSHPAHTARVTQLQVGVLQRTVTLTRDHEGTTRAAFEMTLAPRQALAARAPDYVAL